MSVFDGCTCNHPDTWYDYACRCCNPRLYAKPKAKPETTDERD